MESRFIWRRKLRWCHKRMRRRFPHRNSHGFWIQGSRGDRVILWTFWSFHINPTRFCCNWVCWNQNEVIKPTVNGVLGIMKACDKAKTVRRIVFTSSAGTVNVEEHQKNVYDENDWSDLDFIMSKKMTGWVSIKNIYKLYVIISN